MGISDVKLHRFLSVPDDILLCKSESVTTVCNDLSVKSCDTGRLNVRNKSFKFHTRSSFSSGTDSKLPEGLHFKNWTSDINKGYIKEGNKVTFQTDNEMRREMTVLRDSRNRRQALGNIFEDTNKEDVDNIMSIYENSTNTVKAGDTFADDIPQHRRQALADIFQDVSEDELEHLFGISDRNSDNFEVVTSGRRRALADIFADISEEQLRNILQNCRLQIERSRSVNDNGLEIPRRCRRCAKANIFDGVGQEDIQRVLQINEYDSVNEEMDEQNVPICRRFGLADIFRDVSEDDLWRILSMFEEEVDGENETDGRQHETDTRAVDHRRLALADIFRDVSEDDLDKILSDITDDVGENDTSQVNVNRHRREAFGDIFCDVESSELQNLLSKYGSAIEKYEDEGV